MKGRAWAVHRYRQVRRAGLVGTFSLLHWKTSVFLRRQAWRRRAKRFPTGLHSWRSEKGLLRWVTPFPPGKGGVPSGWAQGQFDLLSSGLRDLGCEGPREGDLPSAWLPTAQRVRALVSPGHRWIDWQRDPVSGHRWSARECSADIRYGHQAGVEVKWPWELGRLQHLPALARRAGSAGNRRDVLPAIRDQIIDFVAQNPPGFGIQWACPMDVGIRIANLLLAVDLLRASGTRLDRALLGLVAASARDHGRYLVGHLEWGGETLSSNHYLANLIGLLLAGAYLPADRETDGWLSFAGREFMCQLAGQFHAEGSNFEGSTCYHRLSGEMAAYGSAFMSALARQRPERCHGWFAGRIPLFRPGKGSLPLPREKGRHFCLEGVNGRRLRGMAAFTASLIRAGGTVPQIGDNDSGRLFRLAMERNPDRDLQDHRHLPDVLSGLTGQARVISGGEGEWVRSWVKPPGSAEAPGVPGKKQGEFFWRGFGLYVWKRPRFTMTFRCGSIGQNGNGGHAHCDQLSITWAVGGVPCVEDPGTGCYTPSPATRNLFRASGTHSTVEFPGVEQGVWEEGRWGLFSMRDVCQPHVHKAEPDEIEATISLGGRPVLRRVSLLQDGIRIQDRAPKGSRIRLVIAPDWLIQPCGQNRFRLRHGPRKALLTMKEGRLESNPWSPRYGSALKTTAVVGLPGTTLLEVL